jgi:hypothetical protein
LDSPIIVSGRGPARLRTLLLAAAVLAALASWGFFEWGRRAGGHDALESIKAREQLAEQIIELESRNTDLRREIALMKAAGRVDREAYGRVSREIGDLESQVAELNEELAFYRDVMSPADGDSELQVQTVQIHPADGEQAFRLRLVLVQPGPQARRVTGTLAVALAGIGTSGKARLSLADVGGEPGDLRYAFRYFQILERDVTLPDGFAPERVEIRLRPARRGAEEIDVTFPWVVEDA